METPHTEQTMNKTDTTSTSTGPVKQGHSAGSGHTPGPWTVEVYDGEAFILNSGEAAPQGICSIRLKHAGLRYDESLANARLIAAAPELLAALKGAQDAMRKALPLLPADNEAIYIERRLALVNAAIAKATDQTCYSGKDGAISTTDTPRTDTAARNIGSVKFPVRVVPADFARQLERENRNLISALKELLDSGENMPAGTMRQHCGTALRVARQAIAKATEARQ